MFFGISAGSTAHAQSALAASQANAAAGKAADAVTAAMGAASDRNDALSQATAATTSAGDALQNALSSFRSTTGPLAATEAAPTTAGDPDEAPAPLTLPQGHAAVVDALASVERLAASAPSSTVFGTDLITVAAKEATDGISRASNQARVTEYLRLLGLNFLDSHGVPTRYCAAGVTWAACHAYCDANAIAYDDASRLAVFRSVLGDIRRSFKPSASCPDIMADARGRGLWVSKTTEPLAGYLVLYNWTGGTDAQHIGIVESKAADGLHTIEFNTTATDTTTGQSNGGAVARKTRNIKFVLGYVKTY